MIYTVQGPIEWDFNAKECFLPPLPTATGKTRSSISLTDEDLTEVAENGGCAPERDHDANSKPHSVNGRKKECMGRVFSNSTTDSGYVSQVTSVHVSPATHQLLGFEDPEEDTVQGKQTRCSCLSCKKIGDSDPSNCRFCNHTPTAGIKEHERLHFWVSESQTYRCMAKVCIFSTITWEDLRFHYVDKHCEDILNGLSIDFELRHLDGASPGNRMKAYEICGPMQKNLAIHRENLRSPNAPASQPLGGHLPTKKKTPVLGPSQLFELRSSLAQIQDLNDSSSKPKDLAAAAKRMDVALWLGVGTTGFEKQKLDLIHSLKPDTKGNKQPMKDDAGRNARDVDSISAPGASPGQNFALSPRIREISPAENDSDSEDSDDNFDSEDEMESLCGKEASLAVAYAKHTIIANLMREVYSRFASADTPLFRSYTSSGSGSPSAPSNTVVSDRRVPQNKPLSKRLREERDRSPPGDDDRKRRRKNSTSDPSQVAFRHFACPCHKFDSVKYSVNETSGSRYRTCAGPGFPSISRMKQHLRRTHSAPIQCQRCWLVMPDITAMREHANLEKRCEPQPPRPEGIDNEKMLLINSRHGASWEDIFGIIYPGQEPIPSPYYGTSENSSQEPLPLSPESRNFQSFDARRRIELPVAIEAELRAITSTELVPVEEGLRLQLEDILRRWIARLATNPEPTNADPSIGRTVQEPDSANANGLYEYPAPIPLHFQPSATSNNPTTQNPPALNFYQEPPYLTDNIPPPIPNQPFQTNNPGLSFPPYSDSGYGSSQYSCRCHCHQSNAYADPIQSNNIYDMYGCNLCSSSHFP